MRKKLRPFLSIAIALTVIISLAGCSSKSVNKAKTAINKHSDVKGLLWKINNKNSTVYLYASYHTMKSDMLPFGKTIENAFDKSNNLVVEFDVSKTAELEKNQGKMFYEGNDNVYNHLSGKGKEKIDSFAKELNLNMNDLKTLKLSYIYSIFLSNEMKKMGFTDNGVDVYFIEKAMNSKKILELESIEKQYDIMSEYPDSELEQQYLIDANNMNEEATKYEKIYEAYVAGDEKTLTKLSIDPIKKYPIYYKEFIVDRNIEMANKVDNYLKTNDTYFVVAGAGHFVGSDSIISFLTKKGYKVQRVY